MRLSREDVAPLAVIIAAGCVAATTTFAALRSWTPMDYAPVELRVENDDFVFNDLRIEIVARPTFSYTIYGDLIGRVESLEARQREVGQRVRDLTMSADRANHTEEVSALRSMKQEMMDAISGLERELDRAGEAVPSLGFRALGVAAELIRESELTAKIRYSQGTIEQWDSGSAIALEQDIEADLKALREQFVNDLAGGHVPDLDRMRPNRR
jgi:hypothetical protein